MELRIVIAASALAVAGLVLAGLSAAALGAARAAAKWPTSDRPALGAVPARIGVGLGVALCAAAAGLGGSMAPVADRWTWVGIIAAAVAVTIGLTVWGAVLLAGKIELSALINSPSSTGGDSRTAMTRVRAEPASLHNPPTTMVPAEDEIAYGQPYPGVVEATTVPPHQPSTPPVPGSPAAPPAIHSGHPPAGHVDAVHTTTSRSDAPDPQKIASRSEETNPAHIPAESEPGRPDPAVPAEALPGWVYTDDTGEWYLVLSITDGRRLMRLVDFELVPAGRVAGLRLAGSVEMVVWPADDAGAGSHDAAGEAEPDAPGPDAAGGTDTPDHREPTTASNTDTGAAGPDGSASTGDPAPGSAGESFLTELDDTDSEAARRLRTGFVGADTEPDPSPNDPRSGVEVDSPGLETGVEPGRVAPAGSDDAATPAPGESARRRTGDDLS